MEQKVLHQTNIACVLLAAGTSSRFGGDKLLYTVNGKPMAAHAIRLHGGIPYSQKILVTQRRHKVIADLAKQEGFAVYCNDAPERGISSTIRIAVDRLLASEVLPVGVLFGVCDQPNLKTETVQKLIGTFLEDGTRIVAPAANDTRGNPVIFPSRLLNELAALEGDTGGGKVIRTHKELLRLVPIMDAAELLDIDEKPSKKS